MEIFLGVAISGLVQFIKTKYETTSFGTLSILAAISLLGAGLYTWLVTAGYWDAVYNILVTAGAFYAFILQRFETKTPSVTI